MVRLNMAGLNRVGLNRVGLNRVYVIESATILNFQPLNA